MDYKAEQEMELEALQAILMDDLTGPLPNRPQIASKVTVRSSPLTTFQVCCRVGR